MTVTKAAVGNSVCTGSLGRSVFAGTAARSTKWQQGGSVQSPSSSDTHVGPWPQAPQTPHRAALLTS